MWPASNLARVTNRLCTRTGCRNRAVATLTYVYADSTAVLGPLSPERQPGAYDLCRQHAHTTSVPKGWEIIRLPDLPEAPPAPTTDDLLALADAVREVGLRHDEVPPPSVREREPRPGEAEVIVLAERRHLRAVPDPQQGLSER